MSPKAKAARSRNRRMHRLSKSHGTREGYMLERRLGLETCTECRRANTDYALALKASKVS